MADISITKASRSRLATGWTRSRSILQRQGALLALIVLILFGSLRYDNFFSTYNFLTVISYNTTFGLIALGMTFVMMTGGIDLSVGSLAALCSVVAALVSPFGLLAAIGAAALAGLIVGLFNGWGIAWLRIPPFLATLAMLLAARGMALVLAKDATVSVNATADWAGLSQGGLFGIPLPVFLLLAYAIGSIVLNFTRFGRHVLAVGGNEEAARLVGLPLERIQLAGYAVKGVLAGEGGGVFFGETRSHRPKKGGGGGVVRTSAAGV